MAEDRPVKVLELFAGMRSIGMAFERRGGVVFSVDWDPGFSDIDLCCDVMDVTPELVLERFGRPDVVWASPDCFAAGQPVWTSAGYKNIEDIRCGDYVLTHRGRMRKVTRFIKKSAYHMRNLKISGCESHLVTNNHPYYARKKVTVGSGPRPMLDPEWVNAEDLTTDYRVGIPINCESIIPSWDGVVKTTSNSYGINQQWIENTLGVLMDNCHFWWLVGRYFGDGCLCDGKDIIDISCMKDERQINDVKRELDLLPIKYTERDTRTDHHFSIANKELCKFLRMFGKGAAGKSITPTILNLPKELLAWFLEGYASADGHWEHHGTTINCSISTISRNIAYGLQMCMLKAFGVYGSMVKRKGGTATIEGRVVNAHDCYTLSFFFCSTRKFYKIEDGMAWVNVRNNESANAQTTVYTMSVEEDESFTVGNICTHNCTTYSVAAISRHREKESHGNLAPKTAKAAAADRVNMHLHNLIMALRPELWFIENPRSGMRKMDFMHGLDGMRHTVTYCHYGDTRMKPTDIWTNHPDPQFKPPCKPGDKCHEAAPRGSRTGTQGLDGSKARSLIPKELCDHIVDISIGFSWDEWERQRHDTETGRQQPLF